MNFGINSAINGLTVNARKLSISAHNLANVNTPGFKRLTSAVQSGKPGQGPRVTGTTRENTPGAALFSGNALDLAIQGSGFFKMLSPNGITGYSRVGIFGLNDQRQITDAFGNLLQPAVTVPGKAESISISNSGMISALVDGREQNLGQIELSGFNNPSGLGGGENGLYLETESSGAPRQGIPGQGGFGEISPGMLEGSNVDISREMVDVLMARHAFSANLKTIQTADEMTRSTLDIKA